jgi:hypothetical protein
MSIRIHDRPTMVDAAGQACAKRSRATASAQADIESAIDRDANSRTHIVVMATPTNFFTSLFSGGRLPARLAKGVIRFILAGRSLYRTQHGAQLNTDTLFLSVGAGMLLMMTSLPISGPPQRPWWVRRYLLIFVVDNNQVRGFDCLTENKDRAIGGAGAHVGDGTVAGGCSFECLIDRQNFYKVGRQLYRAIGPCQAAADA